jgi:hypothetical protein
MRNAELLIKGEELSAIIIPDEGALLSKLIWRERSVLACTPWSDSVVPQDLLATDENSWVKQWRGGWQLCAPTTGLPALNTAETAFHGAASQSKWILENQKSNEAKFSWQSSTGKIFISRRWVIGPGASISVFNILHNRASENSEVFLAEHLILGGDLLGELKTGESVVLIVPESSQLGLLDYAGYPSDIKLPWAEAKEDWGILNSDTPARVSALIDPNPMQVIVQGKDWKANISWQGLRHALLWQEILQSQESPWDGAVLAFGIEPTSTPHGFGSTLGGGITLNPDEKIEWGVTLSLTSSELESV